VNDRSDSLQAGPATGPASERRAGRSGVLGFILRHPVGVLHAIVLLLLAIVVFQNVEPMSIHVLFWSIGAVPKLVVILVAMVVGAVLWEIVRRLLRRS
jgi:uncharacterized integral membrane protein